MLSPRPAAPITSPGAARADFTRRTPPGAMAELRAVVQDGLISHRGRPRVLDAGCGAQMYFRLPPRAHVVGLDIDPDELARNTTVDEKLIGDVQTHPLPADSFDLVICFQVLEHVRRPALALENLKRAVAPGGLLVVAGPNLLSLKGLATRVTPHWFHRVWYRHSGSRLEPFPTYLRYRTTPASVAHWAWRCGLASEYAAVFESAMQVRARAKLRLTGRLWRAIERVVGGGTRGWVQLSATDFAIVLRKPGGAPSAGRAAATSGRRADR